MTPWKKLATLLALSLSVGLVTQTRQAAAQDTDTDEESAESETNIVDPQPWDGRWDGRWDGHGRSCWNICDDRRDYCRRDAWRWGGGGRWDHGGFGPEMRRCQRNFNRCIARCRYGGRGW